MPEKPRPSNAVKGRKSTRPDTLSYGYNSPFADDEHIVRHSLSSEDGMPVLDADDITKQAELLSEERTKAGVNRKFQTPFELSPEELERDARLEGDVEANEEPND